MRMFGSKKEEVQGWGILHNEELHKLTVFWDVMPCNLIDKYKFSKELLPPSSGQKSQLNREMWLVL
jgi:hypothetical protein